MSEPLTWTDHPGGAIRSDGAKVSEFVIGNKREIWGYPAGWRPRCTEELLHLLGPFESFKAAKQEMDYRIAGLV